MSGAEKIMAGLTEAALMERDRADAELRAFVKESNRIEGIVRAPSAVEMREHAEFLRLGMVTIDNLNRFVHAVAKRSIRDQPGMNVYVGEHVPPPGGVDIPLRLADLLSDANAGRQSPYRIHHRYETLHPYMDGNGRSGRVLWLWMMLRSRSGPVALRRGFLHSWYYQSLSEGGR